MPFDVEHLPKQPERLYRNVTCDGCGAALKPVYTDRDDGAWSCLQPDDALEIHLVGGYGMAVDPFDADRHELINLFCAACVQRLCAQWPSIAKIVQAHCSASLGHHCTKERAFVWRTYAACCGSLCAKCGAYGSWQLGLETEGDIYSRRIVKCACGHVGPGKWEWERTETKGA